MDSGGDSGTWPGPGALHVHDHVTGGALEPRGEERWQHPRSSRQVGQSAQRPHRQERCYAPGGHDDRTGPRVTQPARAREDDEVAGEHVYANPSCTVRSRLHYDLAVSAYTTIRDVDAGD